MNINRGKLILVLGMQFLLALVFITGIGRSNPSTLTLYHSYFADIAIPFTFYFLLSINDHQFEFLKPWWAKALSVFLLCSTSETLQFFGVYALATVFDPLDFAMYGIGALLAAAFERGVLAPSLPFWE